MSDKPRVLPPQDEHVETGVIRFGDDWPGVFIRGDHAFAYRHALRVVVDNRNLDNPIFRRVVDGLEGLLESSDLATNSDRLAAIRTRSGPMPTTVVVFGVHAVAAPCAIDTECQYGFLEASLDAAQTERDRLRDACIKINDEVSQTLGKVLGYPWYKDDQENFPGTTEANGVCVGEHVAETLAAEAADRLVHLAATSAILDQARDKAEQSLQVITAASIDRALALEQTVASLRENVTLLEQAVVQISAERNELRERLSGERRIK